MIYPFGWGMGYSRFELGNGELCRENGIRAAVQIRNCGLRRSSEVLHIYAGGRCEPLEKPVKELIDFRKVTAEPGETKTVEFIIDAAAAAKLQKKGFKELLIGCNAADLPVKFAL